MTANQMSGFCNLDHCTHPCCWTYYRKLIKHQVSPRDVEEKKPRSIEAAHQSIHNINADLFVNSGRCSLQGDVYCQRETKNNALLEYLISKKKISSSSSSQPISAKTHLRDSTNINCSRNKISTLDVHEIFDMDELQSDWRKTFQAKDYYIWMPSNKDSRNIKNELRPMRSVKTPILQLAPVSDCRSNSSMHSSTKRDLTFSGCGSEANYQKALSVKVRAIPKSSVKMEPIIDNIMSKTKEWKPAKDNCRLKSLEAAFNQGKMQIHNSTDKSFTKYDALNPGQIYIMDTSIHGDNRDITSSRLSRQPPSSPNDSESGIRRLPLPGKLSKSTQVQFKGVSIIQSTPCDDYSFNVKLEPQQKRMSPLKSALSHRTTSQEGSVDERTSIGDSMMLNALSNRSTLYDDDIFPGSSILSMLQNSYKLIQERSDHLTDRSQQSTPIMADNIPEREVQLHKVNVTYSRTAKSAPDRKLLNIEIPNPPPPSPDISDRYRSISAAPNLTLPE